MTGRKLRGQVRAEGSLDRAPFPGSDHATRPCRVVAYELALSAAGDETSLAATHVEVAHPNKEMCR